MSSSDITLGGVRVTVVAPSAPVFTVSAPDPGPRVEVLPAVGPVGPQGPQGVDVGTSVAKWQGQGPPGLIIGASPGDVYLDLTDGTLYRLT